MKSTIYQIAKMTQKSKGKKYKELMFFDWQIQIEKVHLMRELKNYSIICQGMRLLCEKDQGFCDPMT